VLSDVLTELVVSIAGEAIGEALLPRRGAVSVPMPEGHLNASMGSLAAFLAGLSLLFGSAILLLAVGGRAFPFPLLGLTLFLAVAAGLLARRTFRVTNRRWPLARAALWVARIMIFATLVALLLWALKPSAV
jgi:hypothetical protein